MTVNCTKKIFNIAYSQIQGFGHALSYAGTFYAALKQFCTDVFPEVMHYSKLLINGSGSKKFDACEIFPKCDLQLQHKCVPELLDHHHRCVVCV